MIGIKKIEINLNLNATENIDKIKQTLVNLVPDTKKFSDLQINEVSGIFGNPIKTFKLIIREKKPINQIIDLLKEKLCKNDKKKIYSEFSKRLGKKKNLHLRFKKSSLFNNELLLYDYSDVVRVTIFFMNLETKSPKKIDPLDLREYLIISNILIKE